jgi:hypothetical protein
MATKKHQHSDNNIQAKFINGRNGSNDEQQQKQTESHLSSNNSKMNSQKSLSNDGNNDISSSNIQSKPR